MSNRSFARGLAILAGFEDEPVQTLTSLARRTGLPKATASRLLETLIAEGYVRNTESKQFRLTSKVLELGFSALLSQGITPALEEPLSEIASLCSGAANVVELERHTSLVVARRAAPTGRSKLISLNVTVGSRLPVLHTGHGRMLLAQAPEIAEEILLSPPPETFSPQGPRDIDAIRSAIEEARRNGYCWLEGEFQAGFGAMAVPLHTGDDRIMALGASFTLADHDLEVLRNQLLEPLWQYSKRISSIMRNT